MNHPNIVKFIGGFRQDSKSYLIFEWADGRNLRQYWNDEMNWRRDGELIRWTLEQIHGLASALDNWHNFASGSAMNGRHGDLKPENILRSTRSGDIFQIADLGLAKVHSQPTHIRKNPSTTARGTLRYLSPEVHSSAPQKISRSYDMWSMGCTILEWIVWLVYGPKEFIGFQDDCFPTELEQFFELLEDGTPVIRRKIMRWIGRMENDSLRSDEKCISGALRDLMLFVRDRLLVPASRDEGSGSSDVLTKDSSASGVRSDWFQLLSHSLWVQEERRAGSYARSWEILSQLALVVATTCSTLMSSLLLPNLQVPSNDRGAIS